MAKKAAGGPNKYDVVKRLVEAEPEITRTDVVARAKAHGVNIDVNMASSYASKARRELKANGGESSGGAKPERKKPGRKPGRQKATTVPNGQIGAADDFIALAGLVRKLGASEVKRFVEAIG